MINLMVASDVAPREDNTSRIQQNVPLVVALKLARRRSFTPSVCRKPPKRMLEGKTTRWSRAKVACLNESCRRSVEICSK